MKKTIDYNVEALRGFCALMVVVHHFSNVIDHGYQFRATIIPYTPSGHLMVLIFFMLSGYVIGLTSLGKQSFNVPDYLKKRLVRLYPIYIVAIIITTVLFNEDTRSIIGTALFSQNLFVNVLDNNNALWSLNYEIVYYIFVIPILVLKINIPAVFFILIGLLGISLIKFSFPAILEAYLIGFVFWMSGFAISKIKASETIITSISTDKLISLFLLLLACDFLNVFQLDKLFSHLHLVHSPGVHKFDTMVSLADFSAFPFCLYAIVTASSTKLKWNNFFTILVYFFSWSHLLFLIINGSFFKVNIFYTPAVLLILSTLMLINPYPIFKSISIWAYIGSVSFALYVIHIPIMLYVGKFEFLGTSTISYFVKIGIIAIFAFSIAYVLEKIVQPRIRNLFFHSKVKRV